MHTMEKTPRIITIIGLIFEGVSGVILILTRFFLEKLEQFIVHTDDWAEMTPEEIDSYHSIMDFTSNLLLIMGIIIIVAFIVNLFFFTRLIREKYTAQQAHKVYLYQAIWGGINLLFNQITGILYLISGVQGYQDQKDNTKTREGI